MLKTLLIVCLAQLTILFSAEGVSMSITPSSMVVGSSLADVVLRFELRCSSDGTSNITGVYSFQISRRKFTDTGYTGIAILDAYEGSKPDPSIPADILAKSPNITGSFVGNPPTSGTLTVTMSGEGLTCNDQAEFKCEMTYRATGGSGTATASAHNYFTVNTAPNDVRIADALYKDGDIQLPLTNNSRLNESTRITYRCAANIGDDPSGAILWERSSLTGTSTEFITYTPTVSTDIVQDPVSQAFCSFSRYSSMYYNMTSLDENGIAFRCKVRAYLGAQWYESMSAHRITYSVRTPSSTSSVTTVSSITAEGVSMSVIPSSMVVGSSSASDVPRLYFRCSGGGTSIIAGLYSLQISRRKFTDPGYIGVAQLDAYEGSKPDPNIPADILAKSPNITGSLVGNPPTSGTLTVTIGVRGLTCNDQAEFKCEMTYRTTGGSGTATASAHNYFTVLTAPNDVRITDALYEEDGIQLHLTNESRLNDGTRIMYRCTANIGDNPNVAILWERSSLTGTSTEFITYTPTVSTDIVQDPVSQAICSYSQTSSMYYNMTHLDDNGITFRCKVRAYVGGRCYESMSAHYRSYSVSTPNSTSSVITTSLITDSTTSNNTSPTNSMNKAKFVILVLTVGACVISWTILVQVGQNTRGNSQSSAWVTKLLMILIYAIVRKVQFK